MRNAYYRAAAALGWIVGGLCVLLASAVLGYMQ